MSCITNEWPLGDGRIQQTMDGHCLIQQPIYSTARSPSYRRLHIHLRYTGLFLERVDQPAGASIMAGALAVLIELDEDLLGQALAQLDAPLVKRVDVPHRAFGEGGMLVVDDQSAEGAGRDFLGKDRSRGPVAQEGLVGNQLLGRTFGGDLVRRLANHQSFGLGEEVGGQHPGNQTSAKLPGAIRLITNF